MARNTKDYERRVIDIKQNIIKINECVPFLYKLVKEYEVDSLVEDLVDAVEDGLTKAEFAAFALVTQRPFLKCKDDTERTEC